MLTSNLSEKSAESQVTSNGRLRVCTYTGEQPEERVEAAGDGEVVHGAEALQSQALLSEKVDQPHATGGLLAWVLTRWYLPIMCVL